LNLVAAEENLEGLRFKCVAADKAVLTELPYVP